MTAAIRTRGLCKVFRSGFWLRAKPALRDLDLEVRAGEIFGLLGPNGSGKTTALKLLTGLIQPSAGEASICGIPVSEPKSRANLGFLPEGTFFYEYLTAREFLDAHAALLGLARGPRRAQIETLLERVGMAEAADRQIRHYSKGMRQRVGLAQALLGDPRVLILDEPMSGLDPLGRKDVRDMILELRREGRTVLFSSHILADAEVICDRLAILVGGRKVYEGSLDAHLEQEQIGVELVVEGISEELHAELEHDARRSAAQGARFLFEYADPAVAEKALDRVRGAGGRIRSFVPQRRSLEDLMLALTRGEGAA